MTNSKNTMQSFSFSSWVGPFTIFASILMTVGATVTIINNNVQETNKLEMRVEKLEADVAKIPVIESNVNIIRDDISEIKADIKQLLTQPKK